MFRQVYKSTLKNITRSVLFWMLMFVILGLCIWGAMQPTHLMYYQGVGSIPDTDVRFPQSFSYYLQQVDNSIAATLMNYVIPIFSVFCVASILYRDKEDNFFEIEKAAGISAFTYLTARIVAIMTIILTISFLFSLVRFHLYFTLRTKITIMGTGYYLIDSTIRIIRGVFVLLVPYIFLLVCFTYLLGCLFSKAVYAVVGSIVVVFVNVIFNLFFRSTAPAIVCNFISPPPNAVRAFFRYYGTGSIPMIPDNAGNSVVVSPWQIAVCITLFWCIGLILCVFSYLSLRKREI